MSLVTNAPDVAAGLQALGSRLDLAPRLEPYAEHRWSGRLADRPALCIDDYSGIPFLDVPGVSEYQHRGRLRASEGDLFGAVTPQVDGYEEYCRHHLGLGRVRVLRPAVPLNDIRLGAALQSGEVFESLVSEARRAKGLAIHPYMGIQPVWDLAARIAEAAGTRVEVLAPPPPVTWIANDKSELDRLVELVLGREWLVETHRGRSPAALAAALVDLATRHRQVALKRLRCASATGNQVWRSDTIDPAEPNILQSEVDAFLKRTEWDGLEEVLAVAWEATPLSPSTQTWIPAKGAGEPRLDGVYEQILTGEKGVFVGSRLSTLPTQVNRHLGQAALTVATALQELGYVGRCSFDHLLLGDPEGDFVARIIECNGRWGGTSIPMSLVDRLIAGHRPPYRAQDFISEDLIGMPFSELLRRTGDQLFDPRTGRGRFILYNLGPLHVHGKFDVIALGRTQQEAEHAMTEILPDLLGVRRLDN